MLSLFQAIVLGLVQGITELFPVSSLGHSVLLPGLLGWNINQSTESFLVFLVATHFATALVLFITYRKDWYRIVCCMGRSLAAREIKASEPYAKLGWLLVVSTIPAGILGLIFKDQIRGFFLSPQSAALFLALNGALLFLAEILRKKAKQAETLRGADERIARELSFWQATKVGLLQILALIPGFSRTGSTMTGGLLVGLSHEDAMRYSFLLATPIILAAAVLELPGLVLTGGASAIGITLAGACASALAAYLSVTFLTKYFKTNTLTPFAIYCAAIGILSLVLLGR